MEGRLKIIGTNHLMPKEEIYDIIKKEKPDILGVEFCETRFNLMVLPIMNQQEYFQVPTQKDESLVGKISDSLKKKAEEANQQYGSDMINACIYAQENKLPLEFLDLDVARIKYLMELTPDNEKQGFMQELAKFDQMSTQQVKESTDVNYTLNKLKTDYPVSFEFLISMRELFICKNIFKLMHLHPKKKVLVLIGDGHVGPIMKEVLG